MAALGRNPSPQEEETAEDARESQVGLGYRADLCSQYKQHCPGPAPRAKAYFTACGRGIRARGPPHSSALRHRGRKRSGRSSPSCQKEEEPRVRGVGRVSRPKWVGLELAFPAGDAAADGSGRVSSAAVRAPQVWKWSLSS